MFRYKLRTLLVVLALGPPVLAGIYVLSVGPAARLASEGMISTRTLLLVYAPVVAVVRNNSMARAC